APAPVGAHGSPPLCARPAAVPVEDDAHVLGRRPPSHLGLEAPGIDPIEEPGPARLGCHRATLASRELIGRPSACRPTLAVTLAAGVRPEACTPPPGPRRPARWPSGPSRPRAPH